MASQARNYVVNMHGVEEFEEVADSRIFGD